MVSLSQEGEMPAPSRRALRRATAARPVLVMAYRPK